MEQHEIGLPSQPVYDSDGNESGSIKPVAAGRALSMPIGSVTPEKIVRALALAQTSSGLFAGTMASDYHLHCQICWNVVIRGHGVHWLKAHTFDCPARLAVEWVASQPNATRSEHFILIGADGTQFGSWAKKKFSAIEQAVRTLRWARGDHWRIAKVTIEEVPDSDAQTLHEKAVAECAVDGHQEAEQDGMSGPWFCPRCTEILKPTELPR